MPFTVFYAWQSDRPNNINRGFIENALKQAIETLHAEATVVDAVRDESIALDKDTQGVPGSPAIADSILQKIDACGVFVADVTPVASTEGGKLVPNPNVMLELGYAVRSKSWERVIMVMNTAFGSPADLPFDLRHRRWPFTYNLSAGATEKASERDTLAAKLKGAISIIPRNPSSAESRQEMEDRADQIWSAFRTNILSSNFYGMDNRRNRGLAGLALIPGRPSRPKLDLSDVAKTHPEKLYPLDASGQRPQFRGASIISVLSIDAKSPPYAVTELSEDGTIRAASDHMLVSLEEGELDSTSLALPEGAKGFIPSNEFEQVIISTTFRFCQLLEAYRVGRPWFVRFGFWRMNHFAMGIPLRITRSPADLFTGTQIEPDAIEIAPAQDASSFEAVARLLQSSFDRVWREFGLPQSPNYNNGVWRAR